MKKSIWLTIFLLFLAGCANTTPPNQWQYDSSSSFEEFESSYLKGDFELARDFLQKAIKSAKSSSNLETLASIELSRCALRVGLFKPIKCRKYRELEPLIESKSLKSYAKLLKKSLQQEDVKYLPKQYRDFGKALLEEDYPRANSIVARIKSPTSQMVAGALIKDNLSYKNIEKIVNKLSFYGYRVAVLRWLKFQISKTTEKEKRAILKKKLKILE